MKTLTKLALAVAFLTTSAVAQAEWVSRYQRSNGTYVQPHYRTSANSTVYDNLGYRGYPSQHVSPRRCAFATMKRRLLLSDGLF